MGFGLGLQRFDCFRIAPSERPLGPLTWPTAHFSAKLLAASFNFLLGFSQPKLDIARCYLFAFLCCQFAPKFSSLLAARLIFGIETLLSFCADRNCRLRFSSSTLVSPKIVSFCSYFFLLTAGVCAADCLRLFPLGLFKISCQLLGAFGRDAGGFHFF